MRVWACLLAAITASAVSAESPPWTTLDANPETGIFDLCFTDDCRKSLSFSVYQVMTDTNIDFSANEIISSTVLGDFSMTSETDSDDDGFPDPLVADQETDAGSVAWTNATFYARACIKTPCSPRASNASDFAQLRASRQDAIGVKMEVEHLWESSTIPSMFESYSVARGAARLRLSTAVSPLADEPDVLPMFAISLLVAAIENGEPSTIVSTSSYVDGHMYLHRVSFGSDMFLDLPVYAKVNDVDLPIYMIAKGYTSGLLEDMVLITLMFGPVTNSIHDVDSSAGDDGWSDASDAGWPSWTPSPSPTTTPSAPTTMPGSPAPSPSPGATTAPLTPVPAGGFDTPLQDSAGNAMATRMVAGPRGAFAFCLDATCTPEKLIPMSFAGLRVKGSVDLKLSRFALSPALQFSAPSRYNLSNGGGEVLSSFFQAAVPLSRFRPPRPYNGLSNNNNDAMVEADLFYFLSPGRLVYGDKTFEVPKGALKFSVEIRDWVFPSPTDTLELSIVIGLATANGSATTDSTNDNRQLKLGTSSAVDFPTYAIADGQVVPIRVVTAPADKEGAAMLVTFTFPSFTQNLIYDPVMKAVDPPATTPPVPATTPPATPVVVLDKPKRQVDSWAVAGFLLGFLGLVIIVSVLQCIKKARVKLDFSKIIP